MEKNATPTNIFEASTSLIENDMETKTKITQRDIILWHLQNVGTLTRAQAMSEYGIVELPARIVELKRLGHNITSEKGTSTNRFGKVHFNIYKLEAHKGDA